VLVESCDEAIGIENDNLKLEVKRLEQKIKCWKSKPKRNHLKTTIEIW
jgi:hypothetical protein